MSKEDTERTVTQMEQKIARVDQLGSIMRIESYLRELTLLSRKSTYFFSRPRVFERLICPGRGAFAGLFSENPNARG